MSCQMNQSKAKQSNVMLPSFDKSRGQSNEQYQISRIQEHCD